MHLHKTEAGSNEGEELHKSGLLTVQQAGVLWQLLLAPSAAWLVVS